MTVRLKTRYKFCRRYRTDVWARIFISRKTVKFKRLLAPRPRTNVSIGNFTGNMAKKNKFFTKRRTRHGKNLAVKQKVIKFYSAIKEHQFKRYLQDNKKYRKNLLINTLNELERRLDVVLYRSNLLKTIFNTRFLILHQKVIVGNRIINKPGYLVNPEDLITITNPYWMWKKLKRSRFIWGYPTNHIHVNWKTMKIGLHNKPNSKMLNYPFNIKQRKVLEFYKI